MSEIEPAKSLHLGSAASVTLLPSDRGLDFTFNFDSSRSVSISLDWVRVADLALRIEHFGQEALTMMQVGIDPCRASSREEFELAKLLVCVEPGQQAGDKDIGGAA